MLSARIAEWTLSLAVERQQAASIVGDWSEDPASRDPLWLLGRAFRTASAMAVAPLRYEPKQMAWLALQGYLMWIVLGVSAIVGVIALLAPIGIVIAGMGIIVPERVASFLRWEYLTAITLLMQFEAGRWLAQRAPRRELPAFIALAALHTAAMFVGAMASQEFLNRPPEFSSFLWSLNPLCLIAAGAIHTRWRRIGAIQ